MQKKESSNSVNLEKNRQNNTLCNIAILALIVMSVLYVFDINTVIITVFSGIIVTVYNAIGGWFAWEDLMIEVVSAYVKMGLGGIYVLAAFIAWNSNRQQRV